MRQNRTWWTKATVGISQLVVLAFVMTLVLPGPVKADTDLVALSCRITDEWIRKMINLSTKTPPPTLQETVDFLTQEGWYEIELSFRTGRDSMGIGMFRQCLANP